MSAESHNSTSHARPDNADSGPGPRPDSKTDQKSDQKPGETALPGELISAGSQQLHRKLGGKEIQLFAVGGAIGTCMLFFKLDISVSF